MVRFGQVRAGSGGTCPNLPRFGPARSPNLPTRNPRSMTQRSRRAPQLSPQQNSHTPPYFFPPQPLRDLELRKMLQRQRGESESAPAQEDSSSPLGGDGQSIGRSDSSGSIPCATCARLVPCVQRHTPQHPTIACRAGTPSSALARASVTLTACVWCFFSDRGFSGDDDFAAQAVQGALAPGTLYASAALAEPVALPVCERSERVEQRKGWQGWRWKLATAAATSRQR
jgi:hypothetical protein